MGAAVTASPRRHPAGRRECYPLRRTVDAIFYLLRTGAQWRLLPHEYPPRCAVFYHYAQWREEGTWEHVTQVLRESYRCRIGRNPQPIAGIIDSRLVKTTEMSGPHGYDGGKKIMGRKRQLFLDTQGALLQNKVHPADIHDRADAELFLSGLQLLFSAIERVWADTAYRGLKDWLCRALGWRLSIPQHWWTGGVWTRVGSIGAAAAPERLPGAPTPPGGTRHNRGPACHDPPPTSDHEMDHGQHPSATPLRPVLASPKPWASWEKA
jgi:putative transposase